MQSIQILMMSSGSETLLSPIVNGCLSSGVKIVYTVYIHRPKSNQMCALIYEEEKNHLEAPAVSSIRLDLRRNTSEDESRDWGRGLDGVPLFGGDPGEEGR
jgi:hypothetical protein